MKNLRRIGEGIGETMRLYRLQRVAGGGAAIAIVDCEQRTSVPGLFAVGCVTPANCQMIIAAGDGAVAAQAINRDLFEQALRTGSLRAQRERQVARGSAEPVFLSNN